MSNDKLAEAQQAQPQSDEWVMVPREPTEAMVEAAHNSDECPDGPSSTPDFKAAYVAMLAAATQQAAEPVGFVTAGALLALQTCRNDEYNGTVDLWMRPNESVKANIPLYAMAKESGR